MLSADLLSLSRLQIRTAGADGVSASGKTYSLPSSTSNTGQSATCSGTANLSNNSLSLYAGVLLLTRSDALTTPSSLAWHCQKYQTTPPAMKHRFGALRCGASPKSSSSSPAPLNGGKQGSRSLYSAGLCQYSISPQPSNVIC